MRILHTADWQLGIKLAFVAPERAAQLRAKRFETVRRIGQLAYERKVDVVIVAGDVLDDNAVGRDTLQQTVDALATFAPIATILLPCNHDPATPDSALARLQRQPHVTVADTRQPLSINGGVVYPCPLTSRHHYDDPADWLPARVPGEGVRVAVAHGGALDFGEDAQLPNRIDVARILGIGFDYVALGDWHGTFKVNDRAWYSGAPEPTRFKEKEPGNVLIVEIDEPGATPRVDVVPVAHTRWLKHEVAFSEERQVDELRAHLDQLPERGSTLLDLTLSGQLPLTAKANLDTMLDEYSERLVHLRLSADGIHVQPTDQELQTFTAEGFIGEAVADLHVTDNPGSRDALVLLHRLMQEVR